MPNPIFIRPAHEGEGALFTDWARENPKNGFDPATCLYPSSFTWCGYDRTGPLAFMTIQRPLMLESLAPMPGLDKLRTAQVLKEFTQNAITQAHLQGAGEVYFLSSDPDTDGFAHNHIFERVEVPVYRVRLKDLSQ